MLELKSEKFDTKKLPYKIQDILLILELLKTGECKFSFPKITKKEHKEIRKRWISWQFYFSFSKKTFFFNQLINGEVVELERTEDVILGDVISLGKLHERKLYKISGDEKNNFPYYYLLKKNENNNQLEVAQKETEKNIEDFLLGIVKESLLKGEVKKKATLDGIFRSEYSFQHLKEKNYRFTFVNIMKRIFQKGYLINTIATRKGYFYLPEIFSVGWLSLPEIVKEKEFNLIATHYKKMIQNTPKIKASFQKQFPKIQGLFGDSCQVEFDEFLNKLKKELEIE